MHTLNAIDSDATPITLPRDYSLFRSAFMVALMISFMSFAISLGQLHRVSLPLVLGPVTAWGIGVSFYLKRRWAFDVSPAISHVLAQSTDYITYLTSNLNEIEAGVTPRAFFALAQAMVISDEPQLQECLLKFLEAKEAIASREDQRMGLRSLFLAQVGTGRLDMVELLERFRQRKVTPIE